MKSLYIFIAFILIVSPAFAEEHAEETPPPAKNYIELTLSGSYPDVKIVSAFGGNASTETLHGLLKKLEGFRGDDELTGIVFKIKNVSIGWAKLQEMQTKLLELRDAGKDTVAYLESGGTAEYVLAAAAKRIVLMPTGSLNLTGLRAEILFFKGLLEKLDIHADMLAMGKYKSGIEPYTRDGMSDSFRESMTTLLDELYGQLCTMVAVGRDSMDSETVEMLINQGPFTAEEAREANLVDALHYYDEFLAELKTDETVHVYTPDSERKRRVPDMSSFAGIMQLFSMLNAPQRTQPKAELPKIALIYASGPVLTGVDDIFATSAIITPSELREAFEKAREDKLVHAVVLRVDSPGGSALASDLIWREVVRTQNEKPVIVSMSDTAASGGYYIAMAAGTIVAQPGTLTGSIGVLGGKLNLKGLYNKVGLTKEILAHGTNATLYSDYGGFTPTERERVEKLMQTIYQNFVRKAAEGREKSYAEIDAIAQGRIWTGRQAKELGLVDELGGLEKALAIAKEQGGFDVASEPQLIVLPKPRTFFERILENMIEEPGAKMSLPAYLPLPAMQAQWHYISVMMNLFKNEQVLTILPYDILIR